MLDQFSKKFSALVLEQIIKPDPRTDEDLLHPRNGPHLAQQRQIVGVVGVQIGTGRWGQTGTVLTHPRLALLGAGRMSEIGGWAAHVVDIALEAGVLRQRLHFPQHAGMAAGGNDPPLMEGQGAEVARPEAPAVVGH